MQTDVDVATMRKGLDVQIVARIDVFADFEHHWQGRSGFEISRNDFGEALANGFGYPSCILLPVRKVSRVWEKKFDEFSEV